MTTGKDEELADLIGSKTGLDWYKIRKELPGMSTEELIRTMVDLNLYVNKPLALEIAKRNDAVPLLRKLMEDERYWEEGGPGDAWSPIHAMHILALIKSTEALELLLDTMGNFNEWLIDWIIEDGPGLLFAFGEDAIERLKEFASDDALDIYIRSAATTALTALSRKYPTHKKEVRDHLIKLLNAARDPGLAGFIADDLASLHDPSVMPEIHRAFEDGRIEEDLITEEDVELIIEGVLDDDYERNTEDPLKHFSRENIEYLRSFSYPEPAQKPAKSKKEKKVGRNDPCPCGYTE